MSGSWPSDCEPVSIKRWAHPGGAAGSGVPCFVCCSKHQTQHGRTRVMDFVLATIWHERNRFLPAILAVAFATLLTAMQTGLLLGIFSTVSMPIDRSRADVWVGYPGVESV